MTGPHSCYRPKQPQRSIALTALAERILAAASARTNQGRADVVDHLLRLYGGTVTRDALRPTFTSTEEAA